MSRLYTYPLHRFSFFFVAHPCYNLGNVAARTGRCNNKGVTEHMVASWRISLNCVYDELIECMSPKYGKDMLRTVFLV